MGATFCWRSRGSSSALDAVAGISECAAVFGTGRKAPGRGLRCQSRLGLVQFFLSFFALWARPSPRLETTTTTPPRHPRVSAVAPSAASRSQRTATIATGPTVLSKLARARRRRTSPSRAATVEFATRSSTPTLCTLRGFTRLKRVDAHEVDTRHAVARYVAEEEVGVLP